MTERARMPSKLHIAVCAIAAAHGSATRAGSPRLALCPPRRLSILTSVPAARGVTDWPARWARKTRWRRADLCAEIPAVTVSNSIPTAARVIPPDPASRGLRRRQCISVRCGTWRYRLLVIPGPGKAHSGGSDRARMPKIGVDLFCVALMGRPQWNAPNYGTE